MRIQLADRWGGGRNGTQRLAVRFFGTAFLGYVLATQGAFTGRIWVAVFTGLALALSYLLMFLRLRAPFGRVALVATIVMMLAGALINPYVSLVGTVFYVLGGIILLGQPELSLRLSTGLLITISIVLVVATVTVDRSWSVLFDTVLGALALGLFGINRRQNVIREQQDRVLATRSRELEARNAELLSQTEMTRQETARAAALQERGRIARDIHDVLAHSLGGLIVQLDAAEAELSHGADVAVVGARLQASRQLAVAGLHEARNAVNELRRDPTDSAESSSSDLVDQLLTLVRGPVGVQLGADLEVVGEQRPVPNRITEALTAVTREALTNINKHAAGAQTSATIFYEPEVVRLEFVNGLPASADPAAPADGADRSAAPGLAETGAGAGLAGLKERLVMVGGHCAAGREGARWVLSAECPTGAR